MTLRETRAVFGSRWSGSCPGQPNRRFMKPQKVIQKQANSVGKLLNRDLAPARAVGASAAEVQAFANAVIAAVRAAAAAKIDRMVVTVFISVSSGCATDLRSLSMLRRSSFAAQAHRRSRFAGFALSAMEGLL